MAGKSSRGKNKKGSQNAANASKAAATATANVTEPVVETNGHSEDKVNDVVEQKVVDANGVPPSAEVEAATANPEVKEGENASSENQVKQGDIHLFPVPVKTQFGEKLELQLSPSDSVMDVRQFLLDAPETCFFTCYDLLLHTKDGSSHHLEDYHEISEVADITTGDCSLEMIAALYDDRSIRAHVHRTRELLSLSTLHSSLSTSLALQHESNQNAAAKSGDATKSEVLELENLGFMEDVSGSLSNLLSSPSKEIKCVDSIVFSSFNPPPSYRRLVGDLIYLDVITLDGSKYCITGTTTTFYVNSSSGNTLDPKPTKAASEATTLIGLLQKISSKFKKAFREMLERKASAHPFENIQSLLPPNSWLGLHPVPEHRRDAARAENSLTLSFGSELIGMQRDWNEELQSCREFPHASPQERILRDRALYKVSSDFVDAAISGAIGVISRCIPPINPTDPECFHMYVHNNIFFSFAVDADLEQLSKKQTSEANLNPSEKALAKSSTKVNGDKSSVATSENSAAELASDTPSEAQLAESEQATYASSNNDLKGTKAYQEADVPGLYNLAMAIVDYRGHRVVAQSVLPGILQGDKSDSLLYGSVDNGKKICWNEDFHAKVLEASKRLRVKEHTVLDGSGNVFQIAAPVECKGIVGSDDRHYLLDLMRVTPRDANYTGANSKFCILRPELITAFCQAEGAKNSKSKRESQEEPTSTDSSKVDNAAQVDQTKTAEVPETSDAKPVLIPIGLGTEDMEAVIMVNVLRQAGADVVLASVEPELEVRLSGGTILVADTSISECSDQIFDLVALPGGMPGSVRLRDCKTLEEITKKQAEEKRLYGAICAAPAVTLLPWGLLKRKKTTCHPAFLHKLPTFRAVKTNLQVSEELTTSRGPGTCFQFSVSLVEQLFGESASMEIEKFLLMDTADELSRKKEFNEVEWAVDHTPRVLIPVANGSEDIEVVTVVDILRRAKVDVTVASVEKTLPILGSQCVKMVADTLIKNAAESVYDLIILPGGDSSMERLQKSRILKKLLKDQARFGGKSKLGGWIQ